VVNGFFSNGQPVVPRTAVAQQRQRRTEEEEQQLGTHREQQPEPSIRNNQEQNGSEGTDAVSRRAALGVCRWNGTWREGAERTVTMQCRGLHRERTAGSSLSALALTSLEPSAGQFYSPRHSNHPSTKLSLLHQHCTPLTLHTPTPLAPITAGQRRAVDVGRVQLPACAVDRCFINVADVHLSARVGREAVSLKALGPLCYAVAAFKAFPKHRNLDLCIRKDNGPWETLPAVTTIALGNANYYGGGMKICPHANPSSGSLDVVTICGYTVLGFILRGLHLFSGTHLGFKGVDNYSAEVIEMKVAAAEGDNNEASQEVYVEGDGEALGHLPAVFRELVVLRARELEALELEALELEALALEALELEVLELEALELETLELEALEMEALEPEALELEVLELEALEPEALELEALELEVLELLEALELEALALEALELEVLESEALELEALALEALELEVLELEHREPASRPVSPVRAGRTARRVPRPRPPPVPGTHTMALRPSSAPQRVPLPSPPASSLPEIPDPESDRVRAASPTVMRLLATVVTDPSFESTAASALVAELVDFAAACRLDYAASLVAESESVCPPSVGGKCALGTDVLEDRQEDFECLAAVVPHLVAWLLAPEGDPDALDIPTPRSYAEAISGPYSSQWQTAMDAEMAS
ncbi:unnamed protein product, partial [Closterium sp. Yama58-4]